MRLLDSGSPGSTDLPVATAWLLGACMEARGKQELWTRQKPELLDALRQQAMIQSVESSNRIEGVTVEPERLRPIVLGNSRPRDRPEEEIAGYRRALQWVFRRGERPIDPATILRLHALCQGGSSGDAGEWKKRNNEIIEILPSGSRRIRFVPLSAAKTPDAMKRLCRNYNEGIAENRFPPLLLAMTFVFDFLCIHPFRDGNGRVSRILTTMLLEQQGFVVSRFISIERLIEDSRDEYYEVLKKCSVGWHEGRHSLSPWWNYSLSRLRQAYQNFEARVSSAEDIGKSALIRQAALDQVAEFTLADIRSQCPAASAPLVKRVLGQLKSEGRLTLTGRGRGARWRVVS